MDDNEGVYPWNLSLKLVSVASPSRGSDTFFFVFFVVVLGFFKTFTVHTTVGVLCHHIDVSSILTEGNDIVFFKIFSRWIWGIFNIQIQSDRGHTLMLFMFQNKDKDLPGIYQYRPMVVIHSAW